MALFQVLIIILLLAIGLIVFKVTKSILKAIFFAAAILTLIIVIFGGLLISDAVKFKENFPTQPSLYLLEEDNILIAGFSTIFKEGAEPDYIAEDQLNSFQISYKKENFKEIIGDNYKVFLIKKEIFASLNEIRTGDDALTIEEWSDLLESDTSDDVFKASGVNDETEFKGLLFALGFMTILDEKGAFIIFEEYQEKNIKIYPETIFFKSIKLVPNSLTKKMVSLQGD